MPIRLHFLAGMRFLEQLLWYLAEIVNEADGCVFLQWIVDIVNVDVAFVKQVMENVDRIDGSRT